MPHNPIHGRAGFAGASEGGGSAMTKEATRKAAESLRDSFLTWAAIIDDLLSSDAPDPHSVDPKPHGVVAATEEVAVHVIEAMGRPLSTKALLPIIQQEIPVGGKSPLSTLSARLSSAKRLFRVPEGWAVKP